MVQKPVVFVHAAAPAAPKRGWITPYVSVVLLQRLTRFHAVAAAVAEVCARPWSPLLLVVLQPALQGTEPACSTITRLLIHMECMEAYKRGWSSTAATNRVVVTWHMLLLPRLFSMQSSAAHL
jgi:hypothetical protein